MPKFEPKKRQGIGKARHKVLKEARAAAASKLQRLTCQPLSQIPLAKLSKAGLKKRVERAEERAERAEERAEKAEERAERAERRAEKAEESERK